MDIMPMSSLEGRVLVKQTYQTTVEHFRAMSTRFSRMKIFGRSARNGPFKDADRHIVLHAFNSWGHYKPAHALAVHIAEARPNVVVTILTYKSMHTRCINEFARLSTSRRKSIGSRVNIVDIGSYDDMDVRSVSHFTSIFDALCRSQPLTCQSSKKCIGALPPPSVVIIDPFASHAIDAIRKVAGRRVAVLAWMTAPAGALLRMFGCRELGGLGNLNLQIAAEVAISGRSLDEVNEEIKHDNVSGEIVRVPGIPLMYDYEWFPQEMELKEHHAVKIGQKYMRLTDGIICVTCSAYETTVVEASKLWLSSMGKAWYTVGPLAIPGTNSEGVKERANEEVKSFLDRMQARFGQKSVFYISLGTLYWPKNPEKFWAVLDELLANQVPFIFAHSSSFAHVSDERRKVIEESGIALSIKYAPQEQILAHPAAGWFITHGGWNSIQEALSHRVPLIFWPVGADQPYNSTMITLHHKAGFELLEVRTGERGTRTPYRCKDGLTPTFTIDAARAEIRSVLGRLKEREGQIVRENFEKLSDQMSRTWDKGQESRENLERFFVDFVD